MRKDIFTIDKAMEIAKNHYKGLNCYQEYKDAFYFFVNDGNEYDGGQCTGIVVLKKGGAKLQPYQYFMNPKSEAVTIGEEIMF